MSADSSITSSNETNTAKGGQSAKQLASKERLRQCFDEAARLSSSSSGDNQRVTELLIECVKGDPGNAAYVDAFLNSLQQNREETRNNEQHEPKDVVALQDAAARDEWPAVLELGPSRLASDPNNTKALRTMAEACAALGYYQAELLYLQRSFDLQPNDPDVNRHYGRSLARVGKYAEALDCWQRVEEAKPGDSEAAKMLSMLTIEKSRHGAGMESHQSTATSAAQQVVKKEQPEKKHDAPIDFGLRHVRRETAVKAIDVKLTPVQQLERAVRESPANPHLYLQLANLYMDHQREFDAEQLLAKGLKNTDNDMQVRALWEDVTMLRLQKKLALAEQRAEVEGTPEANTALEEVRRERDRLESDIFLSRCEREPHNASLRYELGMRLKRAGNLREAMQRFDEALHDPAHKPAAAYEMGECQQQFKQYPMALKYFRMASESATRPEQLTCKKTALYQAGLLAVGIKLYRPARRYLSELVQIDPQYKDAAALLREAESHEA